MFRILSIIFLLGAMTPVAGWTAEEGDEARQRSMGQSPSMPETSTNQQILQTLMDIRDSQLSVLQAQVEILSILRAQGKAPPAAAAQRDEPAAPVHRSARKEHKRKPDTRLSAAR